MRSSGLLVVALGGLLAASGCEKSGGADAEKVEALEKRIKALEDEAAASKDAMAFLGKVYEQNRKQIEEEEARTHAPDAIWAVDIKGNQFDGPPSGAYVTIVEAWDFA